MDRLGYFGHVAIVAHLTSQLILLLPPRGKGGGPLEVAAERILRDGRRIDIIFTGKSVPLSTWFLPRFGCPLVTSNDRGRGKRSVKFS